MLFSCSWRADRPKALIASRRLSPVKSVAGRHRLTPSAAP